MVAIETHRLGVVRMTTYIGQGSVSIMNSRRDLLITDKGSTIFLLY